MTGWIAAELDAIIPLTVLGPAGERHRVEAAVDTGFNGFLTLPPDIAMSLHLQRAGVRPATLADGTTAYLTAYVVQVEWDGVPRVDICLAAEGGSLIGMRMLYGHEVTLRVVAGGDVTTRPVLP